MLEIASQIESSAQVVRDRWRASPSLGMILGSGLGGLADEIDVECAIRYADIPHFPQVTALGHVGRLLCGRLAGEPVVAFQGRFHLYEGYSPQQATLPVRLLKALGGRTLVVSNAAGGLNPHYAVGDVMLIEDQINFMFRNPLVGVNDDCLGPRFPDMSAPYDPRLQELAAETARRESFLLHRGVYVALLGPTFETRAEYRMARILGGDAAGMSTVPEVIVARHAGLRVLGLSTITNISSPDAPRQTTGHTVNAAAATAAGKLRAIIRGIVSSFQEKA